MTIEDAIRRELYYSDRVPLSFELYLEYIDEFPEGDGVDLDRIAAVVTPPVERLDDETWCSESPKRIVMPSAFAPLFAWADQNGLMVSSIDICNRMVWLGFAGCG